MQIGQFRGDSPPAGDGSRIERRRSDGEAHKLAERGAPVTLVPLSKPLWILAGCALVAVLHQTREALIPLVLAILLTLVFSGLVEALRRRHIPRAVSASILLLLGAIALGGTIDALWAPAQEWIQNAPRVLRVVEHRIRPARSILVRLNDIAARASELADGAPPPHATVPAAAASPAPAAAPVTALDVITGTGWVLMGIVTVAALTLLLLSAGPPTLARMTAALGGNLHAVQVLHTIDAIRLEVGRYYGTLALINLSLGTATALSMWLLHMPNPVLWGVMAAALNFVPYVGSGITLTVLSVVALVTFDSISHVLLVAATYLGLATLEGQLIEPIFFGRRLHLNPIIVFIALWLGGWLWGIAGVLVALPVLVAMKVAASRPGGSNGLLEFLGAAARQEPESREPEPRVLAPLVPTVLRPRTPR